MKCGNYVSTDRERERERERGLGSVLLSARPEIIPVSGVMNISLKAPEALDRVIDRVWLWSTNERW